MDAIAAYDKSVPPRHREIVRVQHREIAGVLEKAVRDIWDYQGFRAACR